MLKLILPVLMVVTAISAQTLPVKQWSKTYGGPADDIGYATCPTSDSGVVICGYTESYGKGGKDIIFTKLDKSGNFQWYKTFGVESDEEVYSAVETDDGGIIAAGYSIVNSAKKLLLIKIDSHGEYAWSKNYSFKANSEGYVVKKVSGDGFVVAGKTFSGSEERGIILRVSNDGTKMWSYMDSAAYYSSSYYDVTTTVDNQFISVGYTKTAHKMTDIMITLVNSNGEKISDKKYGGNYTDKAFAITNAAFGFMVVGYTNSYGNGEEDCMVMRLTNDGSLIDYRTHGYKCNDRFYSICNIVGDKFVVSGNSKSYGNKNREHTVAILDSTGKVEWSNQYHGICDSVGKNLSTVTDSMFLLNGIFMQPDTSNKDMFVTNTKYATIEQVKPEVIYPFTQRFRCVSSLNEIRFVTGNDSAYWVINGGEEALESTSPGGVAKIASVLTPRFNASRDSGELMVDFVLKFPTEIGPGWQSNNTFTVYLCDSANIPLYTFFFRPNGTEADFENWDMKFEKNSRTIAQTNSRRLTRHGANADWVNFRIGLAPQGKITLYYDAKDGRGVVPHLVTTDRNYMNFYRMGLTFKTGVSDNRNYKILADEISILMKYDYTTPTPTSILGFENGWYSDIPGSISLDSAARTQGSSSLKVSGSILNKLTSSLISTKKMGLVTSNLELDVNIGPNQSSSWYGTLQMFINCPSAGYSNKLIGQYELSQNPVDVFSTASFTIPSGMVQKLNSQNYNDFNFRFYLSSNDNSGPYYFDNMRFVNP